MLYKRLLICYIKDNFDNLGQHWTMQRHTLLAENLGQHWTMQRNTLLAENLGQHWTMQRHTLLAENIDISLRRNCVYGLSVIAEM